MKLETAYASACAVFTRPFTFCEWKVYKVPSATDSTGWAPYFFDKTSETASDTNQAVREITHDAWIYVFRNLEGTEGAASEWVEELFQAEDGTLYAAPMAEQKAQLKKDPKTEPKTRPDVKPIGKTTPSIGKTTTFARRINGARALHYVFASRVRLPIPSIDTLQHQIGNWAPAYTFEHGDIDVREKGGTLMVPALDPITIALHLHTYAVIAAQDSIEYAGDQSVGNANRQTKVMLAQVLQSLIEADDAQAEDKHGSLAQGIYAEKDKNNKKVWNPDVLKTFGDEYAQQVQYRRILRLRWSHYLVNWLDSEPFRIAFDAYAHARPAEALLLICRLLDRISDTDLGRQLALRINSGKHKKDGDDKWGWVSQYIFPAEGDLDKSWEIIDKLSGNNVYALKEWTSLISTGAIPPTYIVKVIDIQLAKAGVKPVVLVPLTKEVPLPQFWKNRQGTEFVMYQIEPGEEAKVTGKWEVRLAKFEMVLKLVSAAFVAKQISEALGKDADTEKKVMAVVAGIHAVADLGAAAKEIQIGYQKYAAQLAREATEETEHAIEAYEVAAGRIAAIASITDVIAGIVETKHSIEEGEKKVAIGHIVSTLGYSFEFIGALAAALSVPGLGEIVIVGATLVMIGNVIVKIFKKTDYELFISRCAWGEEEGEEGNKEWAVAPFQQWPGRYDLQLKSLIQLLCKVEIDGDRWSAKADIPTDPEKIRAVEVKLGWLPLGARIDATYEEVWDGNGSQTLTGSWDVTEQNSVTGEYTIYPAKASTLGINLKGGKLELRPLGKSPRSDLVEQTSEARHSYYWWNKDFRELKVGIRLILPLGKEEISVPYEENQFKEGVVAHNEKEVPESDHPTR